MIITIDSEIQSLLLDWYNLEDDTKDRIANMLTDTGITLKNSGKKGITVIRNKIHYSYRSYEIRFLLCKLLTRGEERFQKVDILDLFFTNDVKYNEQNEMNFSLFNTFFQKI